MPKKYISFEKSLGRTGNVEKARHFGHDVEMGSLNDRSHSMNDKHGVTIKKKTHKRSGKKYLPNLLRCDDDVPMVSTCNNSRHTYSRKNDKSSRRKSTPLPLSYLKERQSRRIFISDSNLYKVTIPQGKNYSKEFVLGSLLDCAAPLFFTPIMYQIVGVDAIFYVEEHEVACKLADWDKRIATNDGFKIQVMVRPGEPLVQITDTLKDRLKQVIGKRYIQDTNALNLSNFHRDPELVGDYWCLLSRSYMLTTVLEIVHEHIPNLEALNLDCNKMYHLEKLGSLASQFKQLKILHIGDNNIRQMYYLKALKSLQLQELRLEGNPLCDKYNRKDQTAYTEDVQKILPKLSKLDGVHLSPVIVYDLADKKINLPLAQRMFIAQSNTKAHEVASQFLQQYFAIFDSGNRLPLLDAYHQDARLSVTATLPRNFGGFSECLEENRNLRRVLNSSRKRKLLKQGRLPVVAFISELPPTKHNLNSFTMDLSLVTHSTMLVTVTGLYKEIIAADKMEFVRYFNRTLMIVPVGAGFCISNEQLHISNPTAEQEKQFSCAPLTVQSTGISSTTATVAVCSAPLTEEVKEQMTVSLSKQTNMTIAWSLRCLEEVQWNFENACAAFQEAFSLGKVPSCAFTTSSRI